MPNIMGDVSPTAQKSENSLVLDPNDDENSWRRSKSDASFFLGETKSKNLIPGKRTDNVSEHSAVYWNIAEAVEESETLSTPRNSASHGTRECLYKSSKPTGAINPNECATVGKPGLPVHSGTVLLSDVLESPSESTRILEPLRQQSPSTLRKPQTTLPDIIRKSCRDEWSGTTATVYSYREKQKQHRTDYNCYSSDSRVRRRELLEESPGDTSSSVGPLNSSPRPNQGHRHQTMAKSDIDRALKDQVHSLESALRRISCDLNNRENQSACKVLDICDEFLNTAVEADATCDNRLIREMGTTVLGTINEFLNNFTDSEDCFLSPEPNLQSLEAPLSVSMYNITDELPVQPTKIKHLSQGPPIIRSTEAQGNNLSLPSTAQIIFHSTRILNRILRLFDLTILVKDKVDASVRNGKPKREHQNGNAHFVGLTLPHQFEPLELHRIYNQLLAGSRKSRNNAPLYAEFLAALEPLLQKTEQLNLNNTGSFHELISELTFACRSNDICTLRHVALDLVNLTVFGNVNVGYDSIIIWLSRLALHPDIAVQYLALLTAIFLSTKPELVSSVLNSGMLDLVRPFVKKHSPEEFAKKYFMNVFICVCHTSMSDSSPASCYRCYVRATRNWLKYLLHALDLHCSESRILAAFHFVADFTIKSSDIAKIALNIEENHLEQRATLEDGVTVEALRKLYRNACSIDSLESELGLKALKIFGKELPYRLSPHVPSWSVVDVICWLERAGFKDLCESFTSLNIDGRTLLSLEDSDVQYGLNVANPIVRLKFFQQLNQLKLEADYSSIDHTNLVEWLVWATKLIPKSQTTLTGKPGKPTVNEQFVMVPCSGQSQAVRMDSPGNLRQYAYNLIAAGVDRMHVIQLTEEKLVSDCHVINGIHRAQILAGVQALRSCGAVSENLQMVDCFDETEVPYRELDAFISYRRSTGDCLASLVRAHLQARNYRVFLDVSSMPAGKFPESIQSAIHNSNNFILILTSDALDRCKMDEKLHDWIHREIVLAMEYNCNIIPVFDSKFKWPDPANLPEDMRQISVYHGVTWRHEYQEAWVDELERLMKVRSNIHRQSGN